MVPLEFVKAGIPRGPSGELSRLSRFIVLLYEAVAYGYAVTSFKEFAKQGFGSGGERFKRSDTAKVVAQDFGRNL